MPKSDVWYLLFYKNAMPWSNISKRIKKRRRYAAQINNFPFVEKHISTKRAIPHLRTYTGMP